MGRQAATWTRLCRGAGSRILQTHTSIVLICSNSPGAPFLSSNIMCSAKGEPDYANRPKKMHDVRIYMQRDRTNVLEQLGTTYVYATIHMFRHTYKAISELYSMLFFSVTLSLEQAEVTRK